MLECLSPQFKQGLQAHAQHPTSSTHRDAHFYRLIRTLDGQSGPLLDELAVGTPFELSGRRFIKKRTQRTRCLCLAIDEGVDYQISRLAEVRILDDHRSMPG